MVLSVGGEAAKDFWWIHLYFFLFLMKLLPAVSICNSALLSCRAKGWGLSKSMIGTSEPRYLCWSQCHVALRKVPLITTGEPQGTGQRVCVSLGDQIPLSHLSIRTPCLQVIDKRSSDQCDNGSMVLTSAEHCVPRGLTHAWCRNWLHENAWRALSHPGHSRDSLQKLNTNQCAALTSHHSKLEA